MSSGTGSKCLRRSRHWSMYDWQQKAVSSSVACQADNGLLPILGRMRRAPLRCLPGLLGYHAPETLYFVLVVGGAGVAMTCTERLEGL